MEEEGGEEGESMKNSDNSGGGTILNENNGALSGDNIW
jgi:hypothetical protein